MVKGGEFMRKNFYDFIRFPKKEIREDARLKYFNSNNLRLNIQFSKRDAFANTYDSNGVAIYGANCESIYDIINEFNNNIPYLDIPLLEMYNYYDLMIKSYEKEEKTFYEALFRQCCRNLSCELFIYEEKIKNVLRKVLNFDFEKTKCDKDFWLELKKAVKKSKLGKNFKKLFYLFRKNIVIKKLRLIRNNAVHNTSRLLLYLTPDNEKENVELFENIKFYLQELLKVKEAFEEYLKSII